MESIMEKNNSSSKRKSRTTRTTMIVIVVVLLVAAGAYFAWPKAETVEATPALQTTKVRTGDLVITASGAGTVVPSAQVDLAFRTGGILNELNVAVGDTVERGQVLARLEGSVQAEADFQALFTAAGLAQAELAAINAQEALDESTNILKYLLGADAYYWEMQLNQAEETLTQLNADPAATATQKNDTQAVVDNARTKRDYFLDKYIVALAKSGEYFIDDSDLALARSNVENAKLLLQDAQSALEIVKGGPSALQSPLTTQGPEMERLEQARLNVENSRLVSPFDGVVTRLDAVVGQSVGSSSLLTVATTNQLLVRFYLDETDLGKANVSNRVTFTFDAYPDQSIGGEIVSVEPALQTVDGTPVVVAWAKLTEESEAVILSGMTVEVEVIAAEARNVLLVPVQALRELAPGSYAVFVVQADGSLQMTPVTVGLRDYANAEILSGLKVGDVVSTGTVETK
ncbi:MAG: efflux RND transporter periplasmic adaptor subunit [Anaerolineaceae bacterium]|nr:MAG: efflux RND transporter periplasmic adaptor subunit [Anaerolineaceae bacterium]